MAEVDRRLAARVPRWTSMTYGRLIAEIDREIVTMDPDAVRRARDAKRDRDITVWHGADGIAEISGRLLGHRRPGSRPAPRRAGGHRLPGRPTHGRRTPRRRDGSAAAGAERLMCRCGGPECPATAATASPIVIHVVADRSTLDGTAENPLPGGRRRTYPAGVVAGFGRISTTASADPALRLRRARLPALAHTHRFRTPAIDAVPGPGLRCCRQPSATWTTPHRGPRAERRTHQISSVSAVFII